MKNWFDGWNEIINPGQDLGQMFETKRSDKMDILFKGKRIDNGEWVEGFYWVEEDRNANKHHIYTFEKIGDTDLIRIIGNFKVDPATVEIVTPMYKAAPAMYEALKELFSLNVGNSFNDPIEVGCYCTETGTGAPIKCGWCKAKQALALAEGGE